MRKIAIVFMLMFATTLLAQETKDTKPAATPQPRSQFAWAQGGYRLEYVIKEVDDGKVINSRSYLMTIEASDTRSNGRETLKTGNRIPVPTSSKDGGTQFQYIDIGVNIDAHLFMQENANLLLETTVEISALAANEPSQGITAPAIRQVRCTATGDVAVAKANQIAALDDSVSKHRFIIEVTPTKLR